MDVGLLYHRWLPPFFRWNTKNSSHSTVVASSRCVQFPVLAFPNLIIVFDFSGSRIMGLFLGLFVTLRTGVTDGEPGADAKCERESKGLVKSRFSPLEAYLAGLVPILA
jgi:hypothetical protein